jgi:hypothetical protein
VKRVVDTLDLAHWRCFAIRDQDPKPKVSSLF